LVPRQVETELDHLQNALPPQAVQEKILDPLLTIKVFLTDLPIECGVLPQLGVLVSLLLGLLGKELEVLRVLVELGEVLQKRILIL